MYVNMGSHHMLQMYITLEPQKCNDAHGLLYSKHHWMKSL